MNFLKIKIFVTFEISLASNLTKRKMTIIINKDNSSNISNILNKKLKSRNKKDNLAKHFGKLKRKIDGIEYQSKIRINED
ncbi:MAG: hypothetical protein MH472_10205 [Bacteroidia bacterium]|nr:hypothetical protein [Bacteroidia bacterium]